jgi:tight adherence protein C
MKAALLAAGWAALMLGWAWSHRPAGRWERLAPLATPPRLRFRPIRSSPWRLACAGAIVAVTGLVVLGPLGTSALLVVLMLARRARSVRSARRWKARRRSRLPDAIDLLTVSAAAGLTHREGIRLVARRGPPELRPTFAEVAARMDAGEPLAVALPRLTTAIGEPARALVRAIVTAEQDGAPVRSVLTRLADDARRQRRHDLDAAVRRLPVRLTFPLACCALPAFVLLTVVPLLAAGLHRMGPLAH